MTRAERLRGGVERAEAALREVEQRRDVLEAERSVVSADIATARDALQRLYGRRATVQAKLEYCDDEILEAARQLNEARGEVFNAARDAVRKSLDMEPASVKRVIKILGVVSGPTERQDGRANMVVRVEPGSPIEVGDRYGGWEIAEFVMRGGGQAGITLECARCRGRCTCGFVQQETP